MSLTQHKPRQVARYLIDASEEEECQEDGPGWGEGQRSGGDT